MAIAFVEQTTPPEVTKLHVEVFIEENVFGLYVSVDDVSVMKIGYCKRGLIEEAQGQLLWNSLERMDIEEKISVPCVFEKQIHHGAFLGVVVELNDVWMVDTFVELYFLLEILQIVSGHLLGVDLFKGIDPVVFLELDSNHFGKGSFSQDLFLVQENNIIYRLKHIVY